MNTQHVESVTDVAEQTPATIQRGDLIAHLATIPDRVANAAAELAEARGKYAHRASRLALMALEQPLFPGKKPDDANRPAANDTERMEEQQRELTRLRSQEKNWRMIARLLIAIGEE